MLRDPRDVLTSFYFSVAYSHYIPESRNTGMQSHRKKTREKTIDDFVIEQSQGFKTTYETYAKCLFGKNNVLFMSYEDMVTDFPTWLSEVFKYLQIKPSEQLINKLIDGAQFEVEENIYSHKRQVKPGDHRKKLQVNTIKQLNLELQDVLKIYGWLKDERQEADELFQLNLERAREKLDKFKLLFEQAKHKIISTDKGKFNQFS